MTILTDALGPGASTVGRVVSNGVGIGRLLSPVLVHAAIVVLVAGVTCNVFGSANFVVETFNSDMLLPAAFIWDALHVPHGWQHHQLARVPSLVPDMLAYGVFYVLTASVPLANVLYGFAQSLGLAYAGGWVAARMSGLSIASGTARVAAILAVLGLAALDEYYGHGLNTFLPLIHIGPFVVALMGVASAMTLLERPSDMRAAALAGAAALCFISDQLLLISFVLPVALSVLFLGMISRIGMTAIIRVIVPLGLGLLGGRLSLRLMHVAGLHTGAALLIRPERFAAAARAALAGFPSYLAEHPEHAIVSGGLLLLVVVGAIGAAARGQLRRLPPPVVFGWSVALLSMSALVVFIACFYEDSGSFRYITPLFLWPPVLVASCLPRGRCLSPAFCVAACALCLVAFIGRGRDLRSIAAFDNPVAQCVRQWRGKLGLQAGLAGYWRARSTAAALNWTTQIDQITPSGQPDAWASDAFWFVEDIHDPAFAPKYNFVVIDDLEPDGVTARLGAPAETVSCGSITLWVYPDGAVVQKRLIADTSIANLHPR